MQQAKISFEENQLEFINKYADLGFKDKSSLVRSAIEEFRKKIERQKLAESAELYAEIYDKDIELKDIFDSVIGDWTE